ncbi:MAG: hypothetical protein ACOC44_00960 [Promethearchaeia archaeon]
MSIKPTDSDEQKFLSNVTAFLNEIKLLQLIKSANILIDLFGFQSAFDRIHEDEIGDQIEMYFPSLSGSITFTLVADKDQFHAVSGKPSHPVAKIVINVEEKDVLRIISEILVLNDNLFGLLKIAPKVLTGKLKIKGSWKAAIKLCRCMMIGKHEMYDGQL